MGNLVTSAVWQIVRPTLRSVKHAQDSNCAVGRLIGCDVWRADDDKLSRPSETAGPAALGKISKTADRGDDPFIDGDRGRRIVSLDMREDAVAI